MNDKILRYARKDITRQLEQGLVKIGEAKDLLVLLKLSEHKIRSVVERVKEPIAQQVEVAASKAV